MARTFLACLSLIFLLSAPAEAIVVPLTQPNWVELNSQQKQILAPLANDWDRMERFRRQKWLGIAGRYPSMTPEEQQRVQEKMKEWASLTPEQRQTARQKFKTIQKVAPENREVIKQKWEEYKNLPDADKERLKAEATRKPQPKSAAGRAGAKPAAQAGAPPVLPPKPNQPPPPAVP